MSSVAGEEPRGKVNHEPRAVVVNVARPHRGHPVRGRFSAYAPGWWSARREAREASYRGPSLVNRRGASVDLPATAGERERRCRRLLKDRPERAASCAVPTVEAH